MLHSYLIFAQSYQPNSVKYCYNHNITYSPAMSAIQTLTSQQTPHTSPSRASSGVAIVRICEKTDHILMALHFIV